MASFWRRATTVVLRATRWSNKHLDEAAVTDMEAAFRDITKG